MTGVVFSNIMLAALPEALTARRSTSARTRRRRRWPAKTPALLRRRGERRVPRAAGQFNTRDLKSVYLSPNYQAGKDSLAGFQANLQGPGRRRELHQARPARLRRRARRDPRRQAAGGLHLPARRHGHQLHQAVRRRRPRQGHDAALPGSRPTRRDQPGRRVDGRLFNTAHWSPTSRTPRTRSSSPSSRRITSLPTLRVAGLADAASDRRRGARHKGKLDDQGAC